MMSSIDLRGHLIAATRSDAEGLLLSCSRIRSDDSLYFSEPWLFDRPVIVLADLEHVTHRGSLLCLQCSSSTFGAEWDAVLLSFEAGRFQQILLVSGR